MTTNIISSKKVVDDDEDCKCTYMCVYVCICVYMCVYVCIFVDVCGCILVDTPYSVSVYAVYMLGIYIYMLGCVKGYT